MRLVAATLPLLFLVATLPTPALAATDECDAPACQTILVPTPAPVGQKTYYVYSQALTCPPLNGQCTKSPPARVIGLVWEETNKLPGLQRTKTATQNGNVDPDTPIIV